jgi:hypothetical protein
VGGAPRRQQPRQPHDRRRHYWRQRHRDVVPHEGDGDNLLFVQLGADAVERETRAGRLRRRPPWRASGGDCGGPTRSAPARGAWCASLTLRPNRGSWSYRVRTLNQTAASRFSRCMWIGKSATTLKIHVFKICTGPSPSPSLTF